MTEILSKPGVDRTGTDGPPRLNTHRSGSNHSPGNNDDRSVTELSSKLGVNRYGHVFRSGCDNLSLSKHDYNFIHHEDRPVTGLSYRLGDDYSGCVVRSGRDGLF